MTHTLDPALDALAETAHRWDDLMPRKRTAAQTSPRADVATFDPIYQPKDAAKYLGISPRTLRRLNVQRHPMPGTGNRFGYRLSALNEYLARIADPKSRTPKTRIPA